MSAVSPSACNMNYAFSVPPASTPVRKPLEPEVSLVKMATVCGYPGASPRWLPFIHSSFPSGVKPLSARYYGSYTRKDSDRAETRDCQAIVCYKENTCIQLPELIRTSKERRPSTRTDAGYVQKNKVCFKLKGINPKQAYSVNRLRPDVSDQHRHGVACLRVNPQRSNPTDTKSNEATWNLALESVADATLLGINRDARGRLTTTPEVTYLERAVSDSAARRPQDHEPENQADVARSLGRLLENQSRNFVPGLRPRKMKEGQVLGQGMSPRRLRDLLRNDGGKLHYTFYQTDG